MDNMNIEKILELLLHQAENNRTIADQFQQQVVAVYGIHKDIQEAQKEIMSVREDMHKFKDKMMALDDRMDKVSHKLDTRVTLDESQMSDMTICVRRKAIDLGEYLDGIGYYKHKKDFGEVVGATMMGIRAMVKGKFGVNRWFKIREQDFELAMEYLKNMTINDFLNYRRSREKTFRNKKITNKAQ